MTKENISEEQIEKKPRRRKTTVKEAEVGVAGLKQLVCTVCDTVLEEEEIPALEEEVPELDYDVDEIIESEMIQEIIDDEVIPELPREDQVILVYCRSGNRSKTASKTLAELGYTDIYEFGGINSWPYEVIR